MAAFSGEFAFREAVGGPLPNDGASTGGTIRVAASEQRGGDRECRKRGCLYVLNRKPDAAWHFWSRGPFPALHPFRRRRHRAGIGESGDRRAAQSAAFRAVETTHIDRHAAEAFNFA